ncbi:hypothetical protein J4E89_009582 [Alternaria sp. Ai002NY15]|nr:hypothetical protein J4E89_009582 [Alternaria sp. Ai002NY15]
MAGQLSVCERRTSSSVDHTLGSFGTYDFARVLGRAQSLRYIGALYSTSGDGVVVENLEPGQLKKVEVPAMTVPVVAQTMSQDDKIMLSLYYRWAIQALSAFRFMHARSMCIGFFSSQLVWIRPDFSLAVGGFISASAQEIEDELWKDADEDTEAARRVPKLIDENGREIDNSPSCGWDEGEWAADDMIYDMVHHEDPFDESYYTGGVQGSVKADLVDEVIRDIELTAAKVGISISGDEVDIGEKWEDVFEFKDGKLGFKVRSD